MSIPFFDFSRACLGLALILNVACGSDTNSGTPTTPTPSATTPTSWTINTDLNSDHIATFRTSAGALLDIWKDGQSGTIAVRLQYANGPIVHAELDDSGRLKYFEDPGGTRIWVHSYSADGKSVDATLATQAGQSWRAVFELRTPVSGVPLRIAREHSSRPAATRDLLSTLDSLVCGSAVVDVLLAIADGVCLLSGGLLTYANPLAGIPVIIKCVERIAISTALEEAFCGIIKIATQEITNPPGVSTGPIPNSPLPTPTPAPLTPITSIYSGAFNGQSVTTQPCVTGATGICTQTWVAIGTLRVTLRQSASTNQIIGTARLTYTNTRVSAPCDNGPHPSNQIDRTFALTGTTQSFGFDQTDSTETPFGKRIETNAFQATLSGTTITGTMTHSVLSGDDPACRASTRRTVSVILR